MSDLEDAKDKLVLIVYDKQGRLMEQVYWQPGSKTRLTRRTGLHGDTCMVVSYGTAHTWLLENFKGIRVAVGRNRGCWVGEDAAFIINNLG